MKDKILVLLSGGIDSAVVLETFKDYDRLAIGFDYGQPHKIELKSAEKLAANLGVPFEVVKLQNIKKSDDIVFCGRNAVLLSVAFSIAQSKNIKYVAIGNNMSDWDRFPDCRPEFIKAMNVVASVYDITLLAPLMRMTKRDVVTKARNMNLCLNDLWTCYNPVDDKPCGNCYSCIGRKNAEN